MKLVYFIISLLFYSTCFSQIIDLKNGNKLDCDTAYSTGDLTLCSISILENNKSDMDSVLTKLMIKLDSLNIDDRKFRMELLEDDPSYPVELMTDYEVIKHNLINSQASFLKYAELESQIVGEFMGMGREKSIHQNLKKASLYKERTKHLLAYLKS